MSSQFSVINNLSSVNAQRNLGLSQIDLQRSLRRMSSGMRIGNAGEDAASLAIANGLRADSVAFAQASRNANDGIGIVQIADGALSNVGDMLARATTLATQAASGLYGDEERRSMNTEYQQMLSEIDRMVDTTNFKGEKLFDQNSSVSKDIYVGDTQIQSNITVSIAGSSGAGTRAMGLGNTSVATQEGATQLLGRLQHAIQLNSSWRGSLGAQQNRLIGAISTIQIQQQNIMAAESVLSDANMAEEFTNMIKSKILTQSGMASLGQSNASAQMVLELFR